MLASRLPVGGMLAWMRLPRRASPPAVEYFLGDMREALEARRGGFDFIHLSNILDWLGDAERAALLDAARRALRPGGFILIRRLNSDLGATGLDCGVDWLDERAEQLNANDRSAIYAGLHLGRAA